jgi:hypothetical protein
LEKKINFWKKVWEIWRFFGKKLKDFASNFVFQEYASNFGDFCEKARNFMKFFEKKICAF